MLLILLVFALATFAVADFGDAGQLVRVARSAVLGCLVVVLAGAAAVAFFTA